MTAADHEHEAIDVETLIKTYVAMVNAELDDRWTRWLQDLERIVVKEVTGALLARQVTIAVEVALSPGVWNGNIAPVLLRAMV